MLKFNKNNPKPFVIMLFWLCLLFCKTITVAKTGLPTVSKHKMVVNGLIIYMEITATPAIVGSYDFPGLAGNENALLINSFSFTEANQVTIISNTGNLVSGLATPPTITFKTSPMDKALIGFYGKLMARDKITQIKIHVYYFNGTNYKHIEQIILNGAYIESIDATAEDGNTAGIASMVGMKYESIAKTIYAYDNAGVPDPAKNTTMTWNYVTNTP